MKIIKRAWRGEEKLWKIFWLFLVLGNIGLGLFDAAVEGHGVIAEQVSNVIFYVYSIWVLVACWRCALNVRKKFWGYVARVIASLLFLLTVLSLLAILGMSALFGSSNVGAFIGVRSNARQDLKSCEDVMREGTAAANQDADAYTKQHEKEYEDCLAKAMAEAMSQQFKVMDSAVKSMMPADTAKACEEGMTAYATKNGIDPVSYLATTQNVGAWCSPEIIYAIRAKLASSPDAEVRAKYAKAFYARQAEEAIDKMSREFSSHAQYFSPGVYADGRKGICTYNAFTANKLTGGSYSDNVTFSECASKFKSTAWTWCSSAIKDLPPGNTIPAGELLMRQQVNFGPQYNLEENPGPGTVVVARYECRKPAP